MNKNKISREEIAMCLAIEVIQNSGIEDALEAADIYNIILDEIEMEKDIL